VHEPDLIINAAAYTPVDKADSELNLAFAMNETVPYKLAKWAKKHGAPLIHYSTDYVFDGSGTHFGAKTTPQGPWACTAPVNWRERTRLSPPAAPA